MTLIDAQNISKTLYYADIDRDVAEKYGEQKTQLEELREDSRLQAQVLKSRPCTWQIIIFGHMSQGAPLGSQEPLGHTNYMSSLIIGEEKESGMTCTC